MFKEFKKKKMKLFVKIKDFFSQCVRTWRLSRKPEKNEVVNTSKISAIGILILGIIGFVIGLIVELLLKIK